MKKTIAGFILAILGYTVMAQNEGAISPDVMSEIKQSVWDEPDDRALINAVTHNDIKKLAENRAIEGKINHFFSNKVKTAGITDQKSSGRCWLFTGLNILKPIVLEKYRLKEFEFSQTYNFFFDQLEKSNLFLEGIIATRDKEKDDRTVDWLLKTPSETADNGPLFQISSLNTGWYPNRPCPKHISLKTPPPCAV